MKRTAAWVLEVERLWIGSAAWALVHGSYPLVTAIYIPHPPFHFGFSGVGSAAISATGRLDT